MSLLFQYVFDFLRREGQVFDEIGNFDGFDLQEIRMGVCRVVDRENEILVGYFVVLDETDFIADGYIRRKQPDVHGFRYACRLDRQGSFGFGELFHVHE